MIHSLAVHLIANALIISFIYLLQSQFHNAPIINFQKPELIIGTLANTVTKKLWIPPGVKSLIQYYHKHNCLHYNGPPALPIRSGRQT